MYMVCCGHEAVVRGAGPYGRGVMRSRPLACAKKCAGRSYGRGCAGWNEC